MSAVPARDVSDSAEPPIRVSRAVLPKEVLAEIHRLQIELGLSFDTAALRLGYVVTEDISPDRSLGTHITLAGNVAVPGDKLALAHDPYNARSEQVRALRTELLLRSDGTDRANIVALLSPCAGEGRSQLAAELAISFAQLGRPTLLVDADLRHPQQHVLFGADNRRGLARAITEGSPIHPYATEGLPSLSLLTAGPVPPNPLELLSGSRFEELIEQWRDRYEFIVMDTAPIQQYSDGLAVATVVGRVVALSRACHTPYSHMKLMMRRLAATRSRILGAVVNHF